MGGCERVWKGVKDVRGSGRVWEDVGGSGRVWEGRV